MRRAPAGEASRGGGKGGRGVNPETQRILSEITEEQWRGYYRELVLFAYARCRRWLWRSSDRENLPEGHSPDSIVREAVTRLYDGTRIWNHEQYPGTSPVPFLKSVIDSLIWALLSGAEHARVGPLRQAGMELGNDGQEQSFDHLEEGAGLRQTGALSPDEKNLLWKRWKCGSGRRSRTGRTWRSFMNYFPRA